MALDTIIEVKNAGVWFPSPSGLTLKDKLVRLRLKTPKKWAIKGISILVRRGERIVIIGRNGSGKTTLLRVMGGILKPDEGSVSIHGRITSVIELGVGLHPFLTGRENIFLYGTILGFTRKEIEEVWDEIVDFSELGEYLDAPLYSYSSGMKLRLAFSVALFLKSDAFLGDEVYAVADLPFQNKGKERLLYLNKEMNVAYVIVTHDIDVLYLDIWDRAIWIDEGRIRMVGDPPKIADAYKKEVLR